MITDHRGKTPNYVITGGKLVHQPSGRSVDWPMDIRGQRKAHKELKYMVAYNGQ